MVVVKDHYTHFRYGFIEKEKSAPVLSRCIRDVLAKTRSLSHKVVEFLSDNSGEFDNEKVCAVLLEFGVTQRLTAPYTFQQNGKVERENRSIFEMARTLKYSNPDLEFPPQIWTELVTTAVYLLNRLGNSSVKGVTPFELWFEEKPGIKHLRIVGTKCSTHVPEQKRPKLDHKAVVGYLVGYDGNARYRIYVPDRRNVILSRDVVFNEKLQGREEWVILPLNEDIENGKKKRIPNNMNSFIFSCFD